MIGDVSINAHLTQFDSVHGQFLHKVEHSEDDLIINGDHIKVFSESNPLQLPWKELDIDVVCECTGIFT